MAPEGCGVLGGGPSAGEGSRPLAFLEAFLCPMPQHAGPQELARAPSCSPQVRKPRREHPAAVPPLTSPCQPLALNPPGMALSALDWVEQEGTAAWALCVQSRVPCEPVHLDVTLPEELDGRRCVPGAPPSARQSRAFGAGPIGRGQPGWTFAWGWCWARVCA